jgi:hypothetical protein
MFSHFICLTLDPERIHPITECIHDLKTINIFACSSKILSSNENYTIIKKSGILNDMEVEFILKYNISNEYPYEKKMFCGKLYIEKKEYEIKSAIIYNSLQINESCYDNLQIIELF